MAYFALPSQGPANIPVPHADFSFMPFTEKQDRAEGSYGYSHWKRSQVSQPDTP